MGLGQGKSLCRGQGVSWDGSDKAREFPYKDRNVRMCVHVCVSTVLLTV